MNSPIVGIIIAIGTAWWAHSKGYAWYFWVLAGGLIGMIALAVLPDLNKGTFTPEELEKKRKTGNYVGLGISIFAIIVIVFLLTLVNN